MDIRGEFSMLHGYPWLAFMDMTMDMTMDWTMDLTTDLSTRGVQTS